MRHFSLLAMVATLAFGWPTAARSQDGNGPALHLDSLRLTEGPAWHRFRSPHFAIYNEYDGARARLMVDSLEEAFAHAYALLGASVADTAVITVFVTASRTRFVRYMTPVTKGMMGQTKDGREVIVLVQNDSVRAYTRHEVMHAVVPRAWSSGPKLSGGWLREGIATFADGLCQGIPVAVVARDVLRAQPSLTIHQLTTQFLAMHAKARGATYVLAGSLVDYLWSARGSEGVKRLLMGYDSIVPPIPSTSAFGAKTGDVDVLQAWRAHVERKAGSQPGLSWESLQRHGCG